MAVLAVGGAALATAWMNQALLPGIALAAFSFVLIALGWGLPAPICWCSWPSGSRSDVARRLVAVSTGVGVLAFLITVMAIWGVEGHPVEGHPVGADLSAKIHEQATREQAVQEELQNGAKEPFMVALREVWQEPVARQFILFVFVSMFAYSAQDLILEPFAGALFALTPGQSTQLASVQYGGVLLGMILVGVLGPRLGSLRH